MYEHIQYGRQPKTAIVSHMYLCLNKQEKYDIQSNKQALIAVRDYYLKILFTSQNLPRIIKEKALEHTYSNAKLSHMVTVYGQTCGQVPPPSPCFVANAPYSPPKSKKQSRKRLFSALFGLSDWT